MNRKPEHKRLDVLLVERGLVESRQKGQAMILAGEVQVDGKRVDKAGLAIAEGSRIEVHRRSQKYASRGGFKLEGALEDFGVRAEGKICLDVGASTGGFTDCLLQHGAQRVYAVDVNTDQLTWKLRGDERVTCLQMNARELSVVDLPERVELVVADVSFISVNKVLPGAVECAKPGSDLLILIKPQFELKPADIGKGGIVRDSLLHERAIGSVKNTAGSLGLECLGVVPSRLAGAEGNQEYFLHARKVAGIESQ
jgi:23S rRNA (cytidine1920-2'-O)/16S rRNA (cytidine1409-2'-O)-methyltransferase